MARHTFVTTSHMTWDETKTVEILTRSEVKKLVAEALDDAIIDLNAELRKCAKTAEKAETLSESANADASAAREEVARLVETARELFQEVIAETLAPHYRLLAQHLGIELPSQEDTGRKAPKALSKKVVKAVSAKAKTVTKRKAKAPMSSAKKAAVRMGAKRKGTKPSSF